jgi:hypothetical protein
VKATFTPLSFTSRSCTIRSLSGYGSERSSTASTMLKIAVHAPMPNDNVNTAINVKPGFFDNIRAP